MSTLPEFRRHLNEALVRRGLNVTGLRAAAIRPIC